MSFVEHYIESLGFFDDEVYWYIDIANHLGLGRASVTKKIASHAEVLEDMQIIYGPGIFINDIKQSLREVYQSSDLSLFLTDQNELIRRAAEDLHRVRSMSPVARSMDSRKWVVEFEN